MILRIPAFIRTIAHDINAATPTTVIGNGFFYHDKQHYISFHHLPFNHYPIAPYAARLGYAVGHQMAVEIDRA